jgi:tetratricopeptide (TPR) repeat protein
MKKIGILSLMFVAVTITSCKKYLDVKPTQTFGDNLAVSTLQGLQTAVIGGFSQLQGADLYGGGIIANSELMADYIVPGVTIQSDFSLGQLSSHQMNIYNSSAKGMWVSGYQAILTANTVLKYLPNFYNQDSLTCKLLKGECYFIRAAMHFEMVRMFAQPSGFTADDSHLGIPIRLTPGTATSGQTTPRSSVAQVYAQVITDLQAAEALLPADRLSTGPNFVSKYTAEAMLARVYFSQNNFSQAETYASMVINAGYTLNDTTVNSYSIVSSYNQLGTTTTGETVFQIINTINDDPSSGTLHSRFNVAPFGSTVPAYSMNTPFITYLKADSAVRGLRYAKLYKRSFGQFYCKKYDAQYANVSVIRLAEMYLTRAECENQLGDDAAARSDYNKVRVRGGLIADNSSTGSGLLAAIRAERDLELAMEGDHYFEVKRRKGSFNTFGAGVLQWNAPTMIYPIPIQEINENSAMVQNAGY